MTGTLQRYARQLAEVLPHIPKTLRLVWGCARSWTTLWAAVLLLEALLPAATVYLTKPLINGLVGSVRLPGNWHAVLWPAAGMVTVLLLREVLAPILQWIRTAQAALVENHVAQLIHRKSSEVDLAFYDRPEFYDHLHRARQEAAYRPMLLLEGIGGLLGHSVTLITMLVVLMRVAWWFPLALLLSSLPAVYNLLRNAARQSELRAFTTPLERRSWYYDWLLTSREAAQELRLFGLGSHFIHADEQLRGQMRQARTSLAARQGATEFLAAIAGFAFAGIALVSIVMRALSGAISLGECAAFWQAFEQGRKPAQALLGNAGQLYQNSLFLQGLFEFLELQPRITAPVVPVAMPALVRHEIRFRGVRFQYAEAREPALENFDLTIPAGRMVAIIGPNGAGKSTLL